MEEFVHSRIHLLLFFMSPLKFCIWKKSVKNPNLNFVMSKLLLVFLSNSLILFDFTFL